MAEKLDDVLQDANVLLSVTRKYATELAGFGVTAEELQAFVDAIETVNSLETQQREIINTVSAKTAEQNLKLAEARTAIKKLQTAAKAFYVDDKAVLKEFKIGGRPPYSVAITVPELRYLQEVAARRTADLSTRGYTAADAENLLTLAAAIVQIDSEQENAKKLQTAATKGRNDAVKLLRKMKFRIRKSAELCFSGEPGKLGEFKAL